MAKKGDAPKPPDYEKLAEISRENAAVWEGVARDQLAWAKEQGEYGRQVLERVLGVQLPQLEEAFRQAMEDRARYEETYLPIEQDLVEEFRTYDTPERREQEAAERAADVRKAYESQRRNAQQRLEGYGIDPSQLSSMAIDRGIRAEEAAASAMAQNQGRESVEQMGRALRGEAINIGRGLPSQVAQSMGIVNQTAAGAVGNTGATTASAAAAYQPAMQAGQMAQSGYANTANIQNAGYQNALDRWTANANQSAQFWGGLAGLGGAALGNWGEIFGQAGGGEAGGEVPEDLSTVPGVTDRYPAMLAEDEYIIPADVVRRKGTEFFDKLLAKYKDGGEYEQRKAGGSNAKV